MADILPMPLRPVTATPTNAAGPLLLSARDVAAMLSLGLRTIRSMDAAGKLPAPIRLGGSVRWSRDELVAWIGAGCPDRETWQRIKTGV